VKQFLNRALAGIVAAATTGAMAALFLAACTFLMPGTRFGPGADPIGGTLWMVEWGVIVGTILGAIPGILVVSLTRARERPWASLPILLLGTSLGVILFGLPLGLLKGTDASSILLVVACVAGPTLGGIIASRFAPAGP